MLEESIAIETAEVKALSIGKPRLEFVRVANIEYSFAGHFGAHRDGRDDRGSCQECRPWHPEVVKNFLIHPCAPLDATTEMTHIFSRAEVSAAVGFFRRGGQQQPRPGRTAWQA